MWMRYCSVFSPSTVRRQRSGRHSVPRSHWLSAAALHPPTILRESLCYPPLHHIGRTCSRMKISRTTSGLQPLVHADDVGSSPISLRAAAPSADTTSRLRQQQQQQQQQRQQQ
jgi:hypothetical protein